MLSEDALAAFYLALEEQPGDKVTLLALADWYEENDRPDHAACVRWTLQHGYHPFCYRRNSLHQNSIDWHDGWHWWADSSKSFAREWGHPTSCQLPNVMWERLRHSFPYNPSVCKEYPSQRAAYEALFEIWPLVRPLERGNRRREDRR
jgi:uncharacterized protein (TIGR02996 family)